ncbi:MAG TPA: hypothetical protein VFV72_16890 [Candidatus Limnocylindrales bacterium]|nr:hypothetical protein [Candidatus Limnocylindrales bacterium]
MTPDELLPALDAGLVPGIRPERSFENQGDWATGYSVDPQVVKRRPVRVPVHLTPQSAEAWLNRASAAGTEADAIAELVAARPVLVGGGRPALLDRLGGSACTIPSGEGRRTARLVPSAEAEGVRGARCALSEALDRGRPGRLIRG